jgi:hypothetical protein
LKNQSFPKHAEQGVRSNGYKPATFGDVTGAVGSLLTFGKTMKLFTNFWRVGSILVATVFLVTTQACKTTADSNARARLAEDNSRARLSPEQAIDLTRRYCEEKKVDLSGYYAGSAKLLQLKGNLYWVVSYKLKTARPDDLILPGSDVMGFTVTDATKEVKPQLSY